MDKSGAKPPKSVSLENLILCAALQLPKDPFTVITIYNVICAWYPFYRAEPQWWIDQITIEMASMPIMRHFAVYGQRTDLWSLNIDRQPYRSFKTFLLDGDKPAEPVEPIVGSVEPQGWVAVGGFEDTSSSRDDISPEAELENLAQMNQLKQEAKLSTSVSADIENQAFLFILVTPETLPTVPEACKAGGYLQLLKIEAEAEYKVFCVVPIRVEVEATEGNEGTGVVVKEENDSK